MKRFIICLIVLSVSLVHLSAQKYFDLGITGGTSYYLGDINQSRQFYKISPAFGAFTRLNFNNREALKLAVIYMGAKASDADFNNEFQKIRNASFNATFLDIAATFEFHFLPYIIHKKEKGFTPYIFGGAGYQILLNATDNNGNHIIVPFGAGVKYSLSKKIGVGAEWAMRKTFNDHIDGVLNPGGTEMKPVLNNNDWYSFAGFFISFRLNDNSGDCPVYR